MTWKKLQKHVLLSKIKEAGMVVPDIFIPPSFYSNYASLAVTKSQMNGRKDPELLWLIKT